MKYSVCFILFYSYCCATRILLCEMDKVYLVFKLKDEYIAVV